MKTATDDTCVRLFGKRPECVIDPIRNAADVLLWLEEIFITIKNEALNKDNTCRIKQLAEMGAYLASDIGNLAECQYEDMRDHLAKAKHGDESLVPQVTA